MSRGFVREDDQEEAPFIAPRAPLPDGLPNHVTERGLALLHAERTRLEQSREQVQGSDDEKRRDLAVINGTLGLLMERIANARLVPTTLENDVVRFGSRITFLYRGGPQDGQRRTFTIVGVDEASVAEGRIAFTSPLARLLMGKRTGEVVELALRDRIERLTLLSIA